MYMHANMIYINIWYVMQCDVSNECNEMSWYSAQRCKAKITGELLLARRRLDEERSKSESLSRLESSP